MKKQIKTPLLKPLNDEERIILLPLLLKLFKEKTNDKKHLTASVIIKKFNEKKDAIGFKCAFNNQRFMKLTNYIRAKKLIGLVSCGTGYYASSDEETLEACADSLMNRIEAIEAAAIGLYEMAAEIRHEKSMVETCPLGFTWD
jgi:hypothetical protein